MSREILKQYISTLQETWKTYLLHRSVKAVNEHARDIDIVGANSAYEKAAIDLQNELLMNKTVYLSTEKDSIVWLVKHMNIKWPEWLTEGIEGFNDVKGLSTTFSDSLFEHVHRLRNTIIEDYSLNKIKTEKTKDNRPNNGSVELEIEFIELVGKYEQELKKDVIKWKKGDDQIGCAAFCEVLFKNRYLTDKKRNLLAPEIFAFNRYDRIDIRNQMQPAKKKERDKHIEQRFKRFLIKKV